MTWPITGMSCCSERSSPHRRTRPTGSSPSPSSPSRWAWTWSPSRTIPTRPGSWTPGPCCRSSPPAPRPCASHRTWPTCRCGRRPYSPAASPHSTSSAVEGSNSASARERSGTPSPRWADAGSLRQRASMPWRRPSRSSGRSGRPTAGRSGWTASTTACGAPTPAPHPRTMSASGWVRIRSGCWGSPDGSPTDGCPAARTPGPTRCPR